MVLSYPFLTCPDEHEPHFWHNKQKEFKTSKSKFKAGRSTNFFVVDSKVSI